MNPGGKIRLRIEELKATIEYTGFSGYPWREQEIPLREAPSANIRYLVARVGYVVAMKIIASGATRRGGWGEDRSAIFRCFSPSVESRYRRCRKEIEKGLVNRNARMCRHRYTRVYPTRFPGVTLQSIRTPATNRRFFARCTHFHPVPRSSPSFSRQTAATRLVTIRESYPVPFPNVVSKRSRSAYRCVR